MSRQDFTVIRGDTPTLPLELVYSDGTAPDLVDATITFTVYNLFSRTVTDPDLSSGEAELVLNVEDTEDAPNWRTAYKYDCQVAQDDGVIATLMRGLFIVEPDVT